MHWDDGKKWKALSMMDFRVPWYAIWSANGLDGVFRGLFTSYDARRSRSAGEGGFGPSWVETGEGRGAGTQVAQVEPAEIGGRRAWRAAYDASGGELGGRRRRAAWRGIASAGRFGRAQKN